MSQSVVEKKEQPAPLQPYLRPKSKGKTVADKRFRRVPTVNIVSTQAFSYRCSFQSLSAQTAVRNQLVFAHNKKRAAQLSAGLEHTNSCLASPRQGWRASSSSGHKERSPRSPRRGSAGIRKKRSCRQGQDATRRNRQYCRTRLRPPANKDRGQTRRLPCTSPHRPDALKAGTASMR